MDWKALFLTSAGRLGQRDFWIAWLILFVASLVLGMVPLLGQLVMLALIFPTVCVTAKRLHDFGRSGWLAAIPYGIAAVGGVIGAVMGGMTMMMGGFAGQGAANLAALGGMGLMAVVMPVILLAELAFLLWVGLSRGDPQANAYGAPAAPFFGGAAPTPV